MGAIARRRLRAGACLVALAVAGASPGARGQDAVREEIAAQRRVAASAAAQRLVVFGNWCRGRSYKALARDQFEAALRFDPENEAARSSLGHRREGDGWKKPEKREVFSDPNVATPAAATVLERESEAAYREGGAAFAQLAARCVEAGLAAEAREAWEAVLWFDPGHAVAREAVGLGKSDTAWLRGSDEGPGAFDERIRRETGEAYAAALEKYARGPVVRLRETGIDFEECQDDRFHARCSQPATRSRSLLNEMVRTEALWQRAGVVGPRETGARQFRLVAAASKEQYIQLVDGVPGRDDAWRKENKKGGGCWVDDHSYLVWGHGDKWLREVAVHGTTHVLMNELQKEGASWWADPWLGEGAGAFASTVLLGRACVLCVSYEASAGSLKKIDEVDWNEEARRLVRAGEDPPIADLMAAGINDLGLPHILKARSMVAWMLLRSPGAFRTVFEVSGHRGRSESALRIAFGCPPDVLDRRWRLWIRRP